MRRTRSTRAKKTFVEQQDAADDDEFEEQMLERATKAAQADEATRLAKATAKSGCASFFFLFLSSLLTLRLVAASIRHTQTKFSSAMMNLRQIANHPLLKFDDRTEGAETTFDPEDVVNLSGKMMLLDRLLPELFKQGHKVHFSPLPLSNIVAEPSLSRHRSSSSPNSPPCSTSSPSTSTFATGTTTASMDDKKTRLIRRVRRASQTFLLPSV
jgi:SNF2 family DNA or RNA helicase